MNERVKSLLSTLSEDESRMLNIEFLAPHLRGAKVRTRISGIVYAFKAKPGDFEGWGIFRATSATTAELIEEAGFPLVAEYMKLLTAVRLRIARQLSDKTWLAYPSNESDARQRLALARPVPIHLAVGVTQFDQVICGFDGASIWFKDLDRRADPHVADYLRAEFKNASPPGQLRVKGLTPEMRSAYEIAFEHTEKYRREARLKRETSRLRTALDRAGGTLESTRDHGDYWTVEWTAGNGERHRSAISKTDLTVISSGICLSGRDRDFDLTSLVGVMEGRRW